MRNKNAKIVIGFLIVIIVFSGILYENVINRPFPFVYMEYIHTTPDLLSEIVQKKENEFCTNLTEIEKRRIKAALRNEFYIEEFSISEEKIIKIAVRLTRYIMSKSNGSIIRNRLNILTVDSSFKKICSESAKIFTTLLTYFKYKARVVWMCGHTTSEYYSEKYRKWVLADSYGNLMAYRDGVPLSLLETVFLYDDVEWKRILSRDDNNLPDYLSKGKEIYKNQKCFVVLNGNSLFNINKNNRDIKKIMEFFFLGKKVVGIGEQFLTQNSKKFGNVSLWYFYKRFY